MNVNWTREDLRVLHSIKMDWLRWRKLEGPKGTHPQDPPSFQGTLLAEVSSPGGIPAAESSTKTGRGLIRIRRLWYRDDDVTQEDMDVVGPDDQPILFDTVDDEVTEQVCYNISPIQEWAYGDIVLVVPLSLGRFVVVPSAGTGTSDLRHVYVSACISGGLYSGYFASLGLTYPAVTGTGTGTATTSTCDPCASLGDAPIDDPYACSSAPEPDRLLPDPTGDFVYVYDPRGIPLRVPGHAVVSFLGDTIDDPDYTPSGTGTGTSIPQVDVWVVLTGTYELIGIPDRIYECCPGPPKFVKLIRCDTYITEGTKCLGTEDPCPEE